jgi:hypothetical protein
LYSVLYILWRDIYSPGDKKWLHYTIRKEQKFTQDEENTAAQPDY